ncbi:MAG: RNA polymerase sigma factor [Flavobacteriales bacterium]
MRQLTEREMMNGVAAGDHDVLQQIYSKCFPMVRKFILNNNGGEDEAKDIFQDAMVILYRRSQEHGFELTSRVSTYLYAVSRQLWLKQLAAAKARSETIFYAESDYTETEYDDLQESDRILKIVHHCLELLGEPCRSLLNAYYCRNLSMAEIADEMGYTNADNAKNQKYKCFKRLKKLVMVNRKAIEND